jgi:hypothetical protein
MHSHAESTGGETGQPSNEQTLDKGNTPASKEQNE